MCKHLGILLLFIFGLIRGKHHLLNMKEKERLDLCNIIGIQVNCMIQDVIWMYWGGLCGSWGTTISNINGKELTSFHIIENQLDHFTLLAWSWDGVLMEMELIGWLGWVGLVGLLLICWVDWLVDWLVGWFYCFSRSQLNSWLLTSDFHHIQNKGSSKFISCIGKECSALPMAVYRSKRKHAQEQSPSAKYGHLRLSYVEVALSDIQITTSQSIFAF